MNILRWLRRIILSSEKSIKRLFLLKIKRGKKLWKKYKEIQRKKLKQNKNNNNNNNNNNNQ